MGTTADKLQYLNDTKTAIKNAIAAKGVDVPDGTTFRAYADKIASIQDVSSLPTQGAKTVTPATTEQIAVASGRYTTGDVKVAGDGNLVPANIAKGVSIFGVAGSYSGAEPVYELVPPENISFETASYPIRITINLSRSVYAVYGISLFTAIKDGNATATFSYPASSFETPDESLVYGATGNSLGLYTLSGSGNSLYLTKRDNSKLLGKTLSTPFGAAVYYAPR